jgi:hypothetical protein
MYLPEITRPEEFIYSLPSPPFPHHHIIFDKIGLPKKAPIRIAHDSTRKSVVKRFLRKNPDGNFNDLRAVNR